MGYYAYFVVIGNKPTEKKLQGGKVQREVNRNPKSKAAGWG